MINRLIHRGIRKTLTLCRPSTPTIIDPLKRSLIANQQLAGHLGPNTRGVTKFADYEIEFTDLGTLCPQWESLFVRESLKFAAVTEAPRILDCGANHGFASLYFKHVYPKAHVTAFEPDPQLFAILKSNLSRNGAADVEVVQAAVWERTEDLSFCCQGLDSGHVESIPTPGVTGVSQTVKAVRLKDILEGESDIDFVKLDIEGAELPVLRDCEPVLRKVRAMFIEMHEYDPSQRMTAEILTILEKSGFLYKLGELLPVSWRSTPRHATDPFPVQLPGWVCGIWAWRM